MAPAKNPVDVPRTALIDYLVPSDDKPVAEQDTQWILNHVMAVRSRRLKTAE